MKFYLSSYRIPTPSDFFSLIGKEPSVIKVGIIPNAKDYYAPRAWNYKIHDFCSYIASLGMSSEVIDLRTYDNSNDVIEALKDVDAVWVVGGNTFCLRYEIERSGFSKAIKVLLEQGVVYGGDSAGALVAGRSLKGVEKGDEPNFAEEVIWDGMRLVDLSVIPHADSGGFAEVAAYMKEIQEKEGEVVLLTDSQALVIENGIQGIVTATILQ